MRRKLEPLLCELHAHTRWSDGALTIPELVDLYGRAGFDVLRVTDHVVRAGFDVLRVTDHVVRADDPWLDEYVPMRGVPHAGRRVRDGSGRGISS